jgi:serine/threonine protein phosphatase 1
LLILKDMGWRLICIKGNHEQMFQDYLAGLDPSFYLLNGGYETIRSYPTDPYGGIIVPPPHLAFFNALLPYYETDQFILVHAGLRPGVPPAKQSEEDLFWIRHEFIESRCDFGKRVVFGHTHFASPYVDDYKIGIDTGAGYGNLLTCVRLPDVVFYSV